MGPGSYASSDISEASSMGLTAEWLGLSGSEKPGPSLGVLAQRRKPTVLRMVLEALQDGEQRQGTSVVAIKQFILQKYPTVNIIRLKYLLKEALAKGINRGLIIRPLNSKAKGATGRFKLVAKKKRTVHPKKTSTAMATKKPSEVKEKRLKNPRKTKKDPPGANEAKTGSMKPAQVKQFTPKPSTAREKAPRKGGKPTATVAKPGKATKGSPKPEKATKAPSGAAGLSRTSAIKAPPEQRSFSADSLPGDVEAPKKTNAGRKSSKEKVPKGKSNATSPVTKKAATTVKAPKGTAAQGPGKEPKAKATAQPKSKGTTGPPRAPTHLVKSITAPKAPRRPGLPAKAPPSLKVLVKEERAES
ncbi:histone H1.8 [Tenrec ecaudatus]|uniref:histone H1.8 n=1 Tax=Tenrec ecaudatus TaxID=94439 RepID=UPI003F59D2A1